MEEKWNVFVSMQGYPLLIFTDIKELMDQAEGKRWKEISVTQRDRDKEKG